MSAAIDERPGVEPHGESSCKGHVTGIAYTRVRSLTVVTCAGGVHVEELEELMPWNAESEDMWLGGNADGCGAAPRAWNPCCIDASTCTDLAREYGERVLQVQGLL
jgi:hypothetical protein